ncbi:MAG: CotH kinase family protein [Clostridia bacterium]|nr:CotH kinase family protein [Clostridia bacterium]
MKNNKTLLSIGALLLAALMLLSACQKTVKSSQSEESASSPVSSKAEPSDDSQQESEKSEQPQSPSKESNAPSPSKPEPDPDKNPTAIRFEKESMKVETGNEFTLPVTVFPESAESTPINWYTSDSKIARVDETGKITAVRVGTVLITAKSSTNEVFDYITVNVVNKITEVTKLAFESDTFEVALGATKQLPIVIAPALAPLSSLEFICSDDTVLSIDQVGKVTARKIGSAQVTVTSENGLSAQCTVKVTPVVNKVTQIVFESDSLSIDAGEQVQLKTTVLPENADNKNLIFTSSNPSVASVDGNGVLTGVRNGTATITATNHDGTVSATCTVSVTGLADPIDDIDLSDATLDPGEGTYNGGLRVKSSGELMFSPNLSMFRDYLDSEDRKYSEFVARLRFTVLPVDGQSEYVFLSVLVTPEKSKGDWVDFFLVGNEINCGFCPTAEVTYQIELVLMEQQTGKAVFYSVFEQVTASADYAESKYYKPTAPDTQTTIPPVTPSFTVQYKVMGGGTISGLLNQTISQGKQGSVVMAIANPGYKFHMWSDGSTDPVRSGDTLYKDIEISAYFLSTGGSNIPSMHITTESGYPVTSKEYEPATMVITGCEDARYNITATLQIRGRGNSSWSGSASQDSYNSKNSYRIKLDEKEKLLGIGDSKNKDWVLNSNKFDLSGLRNKLVWALAERMGTFTYVPECTWVQLYVNEQYRGMYMVTELVEVANDRVEIDETITESEKKGYFLEIDFRGNYEDTPYFYIDGYGPNPQTELHSAREFVVKNDTCTDEDLAYIQSYIIQCHEAILSGDRAKIEELVDMKSLIDMYILEELSKDVDVGAASFFLHKQAGGKLYFTAPWDFDFGFGTYGPAVSDWGFVSEGDDGCDWYVALVEQEWFRTEVCARMKELEPAIAETIEEIKKLGLELEGAADLNALHWDMYGNSFHSYVSSQVSYYLNCYPEHIDFLTSWTESRWMILYDMLNEY